MLDRSHGSNYTGTGSTASKIGKMLRLSFIEPAYLVEHGRLPSERSGPEGRWRSAPS